MGKRELTIKKALDATIKYVSEYGIENLSVKKVACEINMSDGTIFHYYATKKDLLTQCFYAIISAVDTEINKIKIQDDDGVRFLYDMWHEYVAYFSSHPEEAKYYLQFRFSAYYDEAVVLEQRNRVPYLIEFLSKQLNMSHVQIKMFWLSTLQTSLTFAVSIAEGDIANTEENIEYMKALIFHGICSKLDTREHRNS